MIKSKTELLETLNQIIGENSGDNAIELLEDLSDTLDDFEQRTSDTTNWKNKYEENDKEWREKYKNRFFSKPEPEPEPEPQPEPEQSKPRTFEDLFK